MAVCILCSYTVNQQQSSSVCLGPRTPVAARAHFCHAGSVWSRFGRSSRGLALAAIHSLSVLNGHIHLLTAILAPACLNSVHSHHKLGHPSTTSKQAEALFHESPTYTADDARPTGPCTYQDLTHNVGSLYAGSCRIDTINRAIGYKAIMFVCYYKLYMGLHDRNLHKSWFW